MKRAFVTGGTGFIGRSLVRQLINQGYEVNALVRSEKGAGELLALGAHPVRGEILDKDSMRAAMQGCDVVFHVAGWYRLGAKDFQIAERTNVEGTRNVLTLAYELGIPKIIYTSTLAVFGDTHGALVDESYRMPAYQDFLTEYDRTKWAAHYQVAIPLIQNGAPIIILQPGGVYGPRDHSLIGGLMHAFYWGKFPFPFSPVPNLTLTFAHVDDIAEGHILAAERGKPGETYILAGPALSMNQMIELWSQVTGKKGPLLSVPARFLKPFAPVVTLAEKYFPLPELLSRDAVVILDASYMAKADKAREQLGWQPRPLEQGLQETFAWIASEGKPESQQASRRKMAAGLILGAAAGLLLAWLLRRRQDS